MASPVPKSLDFSDSDLMNYVVRMVTPLRREFSRSLDVAHFMHDKAYAKEILELAVESKDVRLRHSAVYLQNKMLGPRNSAFAATDHAPLADADGLPERRSASPAIARPVATLPKPAAPAKTAAGETDTEVSEAQLRAQMLAKYRSGLR